jgi:hypothetical protein
MVVITGATDGPGRTARAHAAPYDERVRQAIRDRSTRLTARRRTT